MYAIILRHAGYLLPRGKRDCNQCNSMMTYKLVRSDHGQLDKHRNEVCYRAKRTSTFDKNTRKTWTLPCKKKGGIFLNCMTHRSSNNFLETALLSFLYLKTLAAINLARCIHVHLMDRFCIVAKDDIKHSSNVCEINFNNKSKGLYLKILEIRIALAFLNHKISYHQNI